MTFLATHISRRTPGRVSVVISLLALLLWFSVAPARAESPESPGIPIGVGTEPVSSVSGSADVSDQQAGWHGQTWAAGSAFGKPIRTHLSEPSLAFGVGAFLLTGLTLALGIARRRA